MSELRDFLNWFDGFAENIDKTPNQKQWTKIKERVTALREAAPAATAAPAAAPKPPASVKRPDPVYPFIIDHLGAARNGKTKKPILPSEVTDTLYDLRGVDGDMATILWADGSTGLSGAGDLTITVG